MIKMNASNDRRISEALETLTHCGVLRWKDEGNTKRAELIDVHIEHDGSLLCATNQEDKNILRFTRFVRLQSETAQELSREVVAAGIEEAFEAGAQGMRAMSAGAAAAD